MCCGNNETEWTWENAMTPEMRDMQNMLLGISKQRLENNAGMSPAYPGAINATQSPLAVQASNIMSGMMGYPAQGTGYGVPTRPSTSGLSDIGNYGFYDKSRGSLNEPTDPSDPNAPIIFNNPNSGGGIDPITMGAQTPRAGSDLMSLMQMMMNQNRYKSS